MALCLRKPVTRLARRIRPYVFGREPHRNTRSLRQIDVKEERSRRRLHSSRGSVRRQKMPKLLNRNRNQRPVEVTHARRLKLRSHDDYFRRCGNDGRRQGQRRLTITRRSSRYQPAWLGDPGGARRHGQDTSTLDLGCLGRSPCSPPQDTPRPKSSRCSSLAVQVPGIALAREAMQEL